MPSKRFIPDERDEKIRRLEEELWMARAAIIDVMPEPLQHLLNTHFRVSSREDLFDWLPWLTEQVVQAAEQRPGHEMGDYPGTTRAYCPLCGRGSSGPYSRGYSIPVGLERHLQGSHRQIQCSVIRAADRLARDGLKEKDGYKPTGNSPDERVKPWKAPKPAAPPAPTASVGPMATVLQFSKPTKGD